MSHFNGHSDPNTIFLNRGGTGTLPTLPLSKTTGHLGDPRRLMRFIFSDLMSVLDIPLQYQLVIGRRSHPEDPAVDVDLMPFDAVKFGVSRYHAVIRQRGPRITLMDADSTNGTLINRHILEPMQEYPLAHGDRVAFGFLEVTVHFINV